MFFPPRTGTTATSSSARFSPSAAESEYIRATAPVREAVDYVNKTGGVVVFTEGSDIAGVRAPVYSNTWHNYPFRKRMESAKDAAAVRDIFSSLKVAHLIAPNKPDPYEAERVPAFYAFMKACTEPEFRTERHTDALYQAGLQPSCSRPMNLDCIRSWKRSTLVFCSGVSCA